jgi:aspartyl-tRNA(Asn)/glutamyl-tRNA(Gln) amidotransferase subunit A
MKPTYGRVSRYGFVHYASSFDQAGPLSKTVEDCALALSAIAGFDPRDACSLHDPVPDYHAGLRGAEEFKSFRIGIPKEYMGSQIRDDVRQNLTELAARLQDAGALVEECSLPNAKYASSAHYVISSAEFNSNMARYDGVKFGYRAKGYESYEDMLLRTRGEGFGDEVKRRILFGIYSLSGGRFNDYYLQAQKARTMIIEDYRQAFCRYDLLLTPAAPVTAWPLGTAFPDPAQAYMMDMCAVPANLAGLPAISVPWGADKAGLPMGVQVMAPALCDDLVLHAARGIEELREVRAHG